MSVGNRYCPSCRRFVRSERGKPNNLLHFVLCLFTGCLWLPIWLFCAMNQIWNCDQCGAKTYGSKGGLMFERLVLLTFFGLVGFIVLIAFMGGAFSGR